VIIASQENKNMNKTIICPIYKYAKETPENDAIITDSRTYTYFELEEMTSWFATKFVHEGIMEGVRMGLPMSNNETYIAILVALWRIGATAIPLDPRIPGESLSEIFDKLNIGCNFLWENYSAIEGYNGYITKEKPLIKLSSDATIILTSGSSGSEKAVLHSYGNHYYSALGANENIPIEIGDRWLASLPFFHVGGLAILFRSFMVGATVVIPAEDERLEESIRKHEITHLSLVSTQLQRLLKGVDYQSSNLFGDALSSLKAILLGGSSFPEAMIRKAVKLSLPVHTTYGSSEMSSQVTTTPPRASLDALLTSGKLLRHRQLRIDNNGEILVSGETCFKGYWQQGLLFEPFDKEGWFATGDLGYIDGDQYLHVSGRKDNMFISGGENIMPEEIENLLIQIPGIEQAIVMAVENEEYGFRPAAFIEIGNKLPMTREIVLEYLETRIPRFKIPDVFYAWPENIKNSLKVKRPHFPKLLENPHSLTRLFTKK
jgi:o-succinylbenzoate---CoA ligase